jgi:hypothetical protein
LSIEFTKTVAICVIGIIIYGIVHDEITAHLCVEYFTVAHPHLFPTQDPFLLGIAWGIAGTWWVGLLLGSILAFVSQVGTAPKLAAKDLVVRVLALLFVTACCALLAGTVTYFVARAYRLVLPDLAIPVEKHAAFFSVWAAHLASYCVGIIGGLLMILNTWRLRESQRSTRSDLG